MLGIYNYTVILTYMGLLSGFGGIVCAADGSVRGALLCLMVSGVCDMFDGKIASTMPRTKKEKRFGVQIDSLSDLICFGALPALLIYKTAGGGWMAIPAALYVLCALIRLAWFNVDEEERQGRENGRRKVYFGLPVTFAALIFPLYFALVTKYQWNFRTLGAALLLVTAAAFLTPFRLKKPSLHRKKERYDLQDILDAEYIREREA